MRAPASRPRRAAMVAPAVAHVALHGGSATVRLGRTIAAGAELLGSLSLPPGPLDPPCPPVLRSDRSCALRVISLTPRVCPPPWSLRLCCLCSLPSSLLVLVLSASRVSRLLDAGASPFRVSRLASRSRFVLFCFVDHPDPAELRYGASSAIPWSAQSLARWRAAGRDAVADAQAALDAILALADLRRHVLA